MSGVSFGELRTLGKKVSKTIDHKLNQPLAQRLPFFRTKTVGNALMGFDDFDAYAKANPPNPKYQALFEPLMLGSVSLKNRLVMGSMHTGLEDRFYHYGQLARFYEERAKAGVALIITGGIAPNRAGWLKPLSSTLMHKAEVVHHMRLTHAVHKHNTKILLQILHSGRYGYHPFVVAPSKIKSPISPFTPQKMSQKTIKKTIAAFVRCAKLAKLAGYDGVEIMGSEGYLIHQFLSMHTNQRQDEYGGSLDNRMRFALQIVQAVRQAVGDEFIISFRLSVVDLVETGNTMTEVIAIAKALEEAGVSLINSGIGWHESRVPTIVSSVPEASFVRYSHTLKQAINIPVVGANRINMPKVANELIVSGQVDLVQMARPFLADAEWGIKAYKGEDVAINTCIACNQACLDHTFTGEPVSCLVNPSAAREKEFELIAAKRAKRVFVIGGGVAGMTAALIAAKRGHQVTLFEASNELGGQFNYAKQITGKEVFFETLRYYHHALAEAGVEICLNTLVDKSLLNAKKADAVIVATGVVPREIFLPMDADAIEVISYAQLLSGEKQAGKKVAILGAGGIGYDVAHFLTHTQTINQTPKAIAPEQFFSFWGVDANANYQTSGALVTPNAPSPHRQVYLLQRSKGKMGQGLNKTTGWVHRAVLKKSAVTMLSGVSYERVCAEGLWISVNGERQLLPVDTVVVCAGQESVNTLMPTLDDLPNIEHHIIGGARLADRLDAKRAIEEGWRVAMHL
ncbi:MAG: FAD-dependent oxidoreductase [Moraxella sp.]|nr:FAD-dependent oxidoreductase [Moraxella sp.]